MWSYDIYKSGLHNMYVSNRYHDVAIEKMKMQYSDIFDTIRVPSRVLVAGSLGWIEHELFVNGAIHVSTYEPSPRIRETLYANRTLCNYKLPPPLHNWNIYNYAINTARKPRARTLQKVLYVPKIRPCHATLYENHVARVRGTYDTYMVECHTVRHAIEATEAKLAVFDFDNAPQSILSYFESTSDEVLRKHSCTFVVPFAHNDFITNVLFSVLEKRNISYTKNPNNTLLTIGDSNVNPI